MAPSQCPTVYLLPLTDSGAPDIPGSHSYIYLPPPTSPAYLIRFSIQGTSSICRQGSLWVNIPAKGEHFERAKFKEYKLKPDFNRTIEIDIPVVAAGAFAFYTTFTPLPEFSTEPVSSPLPTRTQTHYIDVEPSLVLRKSTLPLDALAIISVISKFMGDDWSKHFNGFGQRGYNMVHFTPLVKRGDSNSPYSIYDQLTFDEEFFPNGEEDVKNMVEKMESEYGLLGLTDVVLNHTANNSKWLEEHPEAGYNLETAPWLESAYELDSALLKFSSNLSSLGMPTTINSRDDLAQVMEGVKKYVIKDLRLWEYYVVDVKRDCKAVVQAWRDGSGMLPTSRNSDVNSLNQVADWPHSKIVDWIVNNAFTGNDRLGERFRRRIQPQAVAALLSARLGHFSTISDESQAYGAVLSILNDINVQYYNEYDTDLTTILDQLSNRIAYMRLEDHGPKLGPISESSPLIEPYFTRLPVNEITKRHHPRSLALVNNGWIWAADAMKDNAGSSSRAYLKREVIIWGDCVKLRYGAGPEDSPFLWKFMAEYTRLMAKYFSGFRIDNCHSTPIHVAEYLLDQARQVRPNLAIFAELFSGSEETDFYFCKRLGISALIREAMQAWSTAEVSRLVHINGGDPIGSFEQSQVAGFDLSDSSDALQVSGHMSGAQVIHTIGESGVHALLFDCTHDNETPAQRRDARDTLPNAALVAMCACATGSVMGYDEVYPKLIDLVHETRLYTSISSSATVETRAGKGGIGGIKRLLNQIHTVMGRDGYTETYIDHKNQYITVHRVHPKSRRGYFLIAHTAFPGYGDGNGDFQPVHLIGTKAKSLGSWRLEVDDSEDARRTTINDAKYLRGLPSQTCQNDGVRIESMGKDTMIYVPTKFPPGSIVVFETWTPGMDHAEGLDTYVTGGARAAFKDVKLTDLNLILYRCEPEERDISGGSDGVYNVPGFGPLVYAGLQGWWSVLQHVVRNNDLGHPLCNHLREGQWALEYCVNRLDRIAKMEGFNAVRGPAAWFRQRFEAISKLPSFLLPRYFAMVIQTGYNAARDRAIERMSDNVQNGPPFLKDLALVSVQMCGHMQSTSLYPRHNVPCLAAGLPHFAFDWARCWGRDVFISMRGLLLGTGRFANAREHILAFASVLKHGMIPNLLGSGKIPRYNSRDSVWFFLQTIQDYTKIVPSGIQLLKDSVKRRFLPNDDTWFPWDDPRAYSKSTSIENIIQEVLQRHATGLSFREANAGPGIDSQMKDDGFQIDIHVDWSNGMIFGGNQWNCGTWMDKMGESERAGSKGYPGTPRDGASVEITGLLYSTLKWLTDLHARGQYSYDGVAMPGKSGFVTFRDWATTIKENFEKCYYIPLEPKEDSSFDINSGVVNRRGIYKDLYRSGKEYEDYQLRPNFPITMTVAPDLFHPQRALYALWMVDKHVRGPTGMATLDPSDYNYRPNYINSEDSTDFWTSKGRNYHSGPEWLWPTGFFLRALLKFDLMRRKTQEEKVESYQQVTRRMAGCVEMIKESPWAGLTELTNQNGSFCADSCPTQAWSAGCMIDLFHDAQQLPKD